MVDVVIQVGRPALPITILKLRPFDAIISRLHPVERYLVIRIIGKRFAIGLRSTSLALREIGDAATLVGPGGIIIRATQLGSQHWRGCQAAVPIVRTQFLT